MFTPDRDAQFRYINEQVKAHQGTADPVISRALIICKLLTQS